MKITILICSLILLLTAGCAHRDKCAIVTYYQYGENGCMEHVYLFRGKVIDYKFWVYKGFVQVDEFLGMDTNKFAQCENPADLNGWYSVEIPIGQGEYILDGVGDGSSVTVRQNIITKRDIKEIIKSLPATRR